MKRRWSPTYPGLTDWGGTERCGFVIKETSVAATWGGLVPPYTFLEVPNVAKDPESNFEIDGSLAAEMYQSRNVIGLWHSHPPGLPQPSTTDREWHPPTLDLYIICDDAIKRFVSMPNSTVYQEVPVPWQA